MTKKSANLHLAILGVYALVTCIMTWPVVGQLTTHVAGEGGDPWQTLWRFEEKTQGGFELFLTDVLGRGEPRLANLSVWPWVPLHAAFDQPTTYNIVWLLSFVLSGFAMYLLVLELTHQNEENTKKKAQRPNNWNIYSPAFLAGLYYMFLPYHAAHAMGHFGAMQTQWLPIILLAAVGWWSQPKTWKVVALGGLVVVQSWTEHHYLLWLGIFAVFAAIFYWRQLVQQLQAKSQSKKHKIQLLILGTILIFGVVLPYRPTAQLAFSEDTPLELGQLQTIRFSADLFAFIIPAPFHSLWGKPVDSLFASHFTGNASEATHYLAISVLLLLVFFHRSLPRGLKLFWLGAATLFFVIALGPRLHLFGTVTGIPLPYTLVDSLPGLASVRAVARAGVMVGLAGAVLLGYVLRAHLHRPSAAVVVAAVVLIEFLIIPVPTQLVAPSDAYKMFKDLPGKTIIEIPAATNYIAASKALYASNIHGKDVVASIALERAEDPTNTAATKALPAVKQLLFIRMTDLREDRTEFFGQDLAETLPDTMAWIHAAGIIIHTDSISPLQRATLQRFLDTQPNLSRYVYDDVIVYIPNDIPPQSDGVFLTRDSRWQQVGFDSTRGANFGEIAKEAAVTLVNVTQAPKQVTLITPLAPESPGTVEIVWDAGAIRSGQSFSLPPGSHTITMRAAGEDKAILMNPQLLVQ